MSKILGIGIAALDIINFVEKYPSEDTEIRALSQRICRGGNVTNTLAILSQLGHECTWGGVWVDEPASQPILDDLNHYHIDKSACRIETHGKMPISYITLNQHTGSRTIIHYRNLPEFSFSDFQKIDLQPFAWLHFEGRNVGEIKQMLQYARQFSSQLTLSLEVEKTRVGIETLFAHVDVLLFSREFAHTHGYTAAWPFLQAMQPLAPQAQLICAWGAEGGYALDDTGGAWMSPAYPPAKVLDTIGAGDTFNAGIIDALCRQHDLEVALQWACQLAGRKCGKIGLQINS